MNNENLENIKTKIKKLLALSKSDNENEAYIALTKANDLINEYKLDEDSLRFEKVHVKSSKTYIPYRAIIGNAVSWLYCCYAYHSLNGTVVFVGENPYSYLAKEMFSYLVNTINRCARKSIRKNAKTKFRKSFKYGMASRIYDRISELGEACSWAPYRDKKIEKAKNIVITQGNFITKKANIYELNNAAINKGIQFGNTVSLSRQAGYTPVLQIQ